MKCGRTRGRRDHPVVYRPARAGEVGRAGGRGRAGEVGRNFASCDLARRLLGYSPTVRIEDGVPLVWQWFADEIFRE
jgi:nucleoside-diphosphate-sugar epimerase